jgi:hypothetical protein
MPPASSFLQYRLKKPIDLMILVRSEKGMYADLSAPVWHAGYIVHNMQHGEFAKSCKPEPDVGPLKSQPIKEVLQLHCTIFVHVVLVEGAGESIKIFMLIVVNRKSKSRKLNTSMFHHWLKMRTKQQFEARVERLGLETVWDPGPGYCGSKDSKLYRLRHHWYLTQTHLSFSSFGHSTTATLMDSTFGTFRNWCFPYASDSEQQVRYVSSHSASQQPLHSERSSYTSSTYVCGGTAIVFEKHICCY